MDKISEEVVQELVRPELDKIDHRLRAAKRTLARKTAVSIGIAVLATKCGLMLGLGPGLADAAGVAAMAAGVGGAGAKYFDDKQGIELSDMYFLWKALSHAE